MLFHIFCVIKSLNRWVSLFFVFIANNNIFLLKEQKFPQLCPENNENKRESSLFAEENPLRKRFSEDYLDRIGRKLSKLNKKEKKGKIQRTNQRISEENELNVEELLARFSPYAHQEAKNDENVINYKLFLNNHRCLDQNFAGFLVTSTNI